CLFPLSPLPPSSSVLFCSTLFFTSLHPPPPLSPLFPYTTLFRSVSACAHSARAYQVCPLAPSLFHVSERKHSRIVPRKRDNCATSTFGAQNLDPIRRVGRFTYFLKAMQY